MNAVDDGSDNVKNIQILSRSFPHLYNIIIFHIIGWSVSSVREGFIL